jgi:pimeloyl-ACP methyl ester carboxylesterase
MTGSKRRRSLGASPSADRGPLPITVGDVALLLSLVGRIRHVLQAAALGAGMTGVASAAYQGYGMARDRRRHPPPGDLVDIGGQRLHLLMAPGAGPPLVIVAALGDPAIVWLAMQRALAPEVPVVLYDRGGPGWSDPARRGRTAGRMADELHALLTAAGIEPPYVLAGHSLGGLIALIYTARHRENVAGLALIDSSHPDMHARLPADSPLISGRREWLLRAARWRLTPLGLVRLADDLGIRRQVSDQAQRNYPPDVAAAARSCCPLASAAARCRNWSTAPVAARRPAPAWPTWAACRWPWSPPASTIPIMPRAVPPPANAAAGMPCGACCRPNSRHCPPTAVTPSPCGQGITFTATTPAWSLAFSVILPTPGRNDQIVGLPKSAGR